MTIDTGDVKGNHHFRQFSVDFIRRTDISTGAQIMYMRWSCNADDFIQSIPGYVKQFKTSEKLTQKYIKELIAAGLLIKFDIRHCYDKKPQALIAYKTVEKPVKDSKPIRVYLERKPDSEKDKFLLIKQAIASFQQKSDFWISDNKQKVDFSIAVKSPETVDISYPEQKVDYQLAEKVPLSTNKYKVTNKIVSSSKELHEEESTFKITEKALQLLTNKNLDVEKEVKAFDKYNGHLRGDRKPNASKLFELWCEKARIEPEKKVRRVTNPLSQSYYHEQKSVNEDDCLGESNIIDVN
ncbi:hypothetical protein [Piscirickettsia litoralis]|uniref:Replication protein n=1 Tax=Piscirickettsia litoralis TaxID=1891921 RepID=A0ABX3A116_9GAMM|nr:hypothetical protein [Piscirickettsia litoralis]ODN41090.1 hypothetical protein BGC07_18260 [Piscirickettsia litoralis]